MSGSNMTAISADEFEKKAYPSASPDIQNWLHEQRGLVRAFLTSDYGRTKIVSPCTKASRGKPAAKTA